MRSGILTAVAGVLLAAAPAFAVVHNNQSNRIRCESGGGYQECRAGNVGSVALERQISKASCVEGKTWGYTRNGVWVDRGCRADFVVNTGAAYSGRNNGTVSTIVCESGGKRQRCTADTHYGVQLGRQISKTNCIEGDTWGYDQHGVWVDRGCRAEFVLGTAASSNLGRRGGYARPSLLTCESEPNRTHTCAANTRFGVEIRRQISKASCVYGKTWGYNANGVWVSNGCRAEFTLGQ